MLEFEEYKVKLNNLKPALEVLRGALKLDAAQKEIEELARGLLERCGEIPEGAEAPEGAENQERKF